MTQSLRHPGVRARRKGHAACARWAGCELRKATARSRPSFEVFALLGRLRMTELD